MSTTQTYGTFYHPDDHDGRPVKISHICAYARGNYSPDWEGCKVVTVEGANGTLRNRAARQWRLEIEQQNERSEQHADEKLDNRDLNRTLDDLNPPATHAQYTLVMQWLLTIATNNPSDIPNLMAFVKDLQQSTPATFAANFDEIKQTLVGDTSVGRYNPTTDK